MPRYDPSTDDVDTRDHGSGVDFGLDTHCGHGVLLGIVHEPRQVHADIDGVAVLLPQDLSRVPEQECPCCRGTFRYDGQADQRRRPKYCSDCQAATADPSVDHLAGNPVYEGGPLSGHKVAVLPGAPLEDRLTALDDDDGHYVLNGRGHYSWSKKKLAVGIEPPKAREADAGRREYARRIAALHLGG